MSVRVINVDASRVDGEVTSNPLVRYAPGFQSEGLANQGLTGAGRESFGRWPANLIHDGSGEVLAAFPDAPGQSGAVRGSEASATGDNGIYGHFDRVAYSEPRGDTGSAARFFYTAKADKEDRAGSKHPTVKPTDLMRYLVRLVTPPGGTVLDPFAGTGSTGVAADQLGFNAVLIEQDATYSDDARRKIERDAGLFAEVA